MQNIFINAGRVDGGSAWKSGGGEGGECVAAVGEHAPSSFHPLSHSTIRTSADEKKFCDQHQQVKHQQQSQKSAQ